MNNKCICSKCYHPLVNVESPYSEVSQEIGDTRISIKVAKDTSSIKSVKSCLTKSSNIDINCADAYGRKCREGCTRVNIISNDEPPPKGPDEKMFLLKSIRQIMPNDDLKNGLELEFKLPRNYLPLRKFDSPPRIIIPNAFAETEIKKPKKKTKSEKKKGTK
ncbi:PREDICTED: uncharacterized protein LOC106784171 [Polistes canadensis]|uniref:uncharacterized protein LOC106784171 n=1 Tax=Polistes canadensis TaxID=91411 RepID=UPI000718C2C0|nr:PREDICTED: uncharacterized protein LOC106784171 [Polistes canadensis]